MLVSAGSSDAVTYEEPEKRRGASSLPDAILLPEPPDGSAWLLSSRENF